MNCTFQSLLASGTGGREMHAIKKGLLWQQRDRIFSRWKERYFILTRDYLHCFKRSSGSGADKISEMGQFIFKVGYTSDRPSHTTADDQSAGLSWCRAPSGPHDQVLSRKSVTV